MGKQKRADPYGSFNFLVEIDGLTAAGFTEVSGLDVEVSVIEYREGGDFLTRKLPGLKKYSNITLKRGWSQDTSLWNWMNQILEGNIQRADGAITLLDDARQPVSRWRFQNGWPCKWLGPTLDAKSGGFAIETLEIVHEKLELEI